MATRWRWARPVSQVKDILYQDTVMRGPSRINAPPVRTASTAILDRVGVEKIASTGLRSVMHEKQRQRPSSFIQTSERKLPTVQKGKVLDKSLYTQRHKWQGYGSLVKLTERGAIVEVMTRFHLACRRWSEVVEGKLAPGQVEHEVSPHVIDDLVDKLSRIASSDPKKWTRVVGQKTAEKSCWLPKQMDSNSRICDMDVPTLAFYAMIDVYDIGGSFGILPSPSSMAAVFHALSTHVGVEVYHEYVYLTLLRLSGRSLQEAQRELAAKRKVEIDGNTLRNLSPLLLQGVIEGYGRVGYPQVGEALLCDLSSQNGQENEKPSTFDSWQLVENLTERVVMTKPVLSHSMGWSSDLRIWVGLIRSRAYSFDLNGALFWLQCFRQIGLPLVREGNKKLDCCKPYMAYILALTSIRKKHLGAKKDIGPDLIPNSKTRYHALCDAISMMQRDGISIPVETLMMIVNLHLGYNEFEKALSIIRLLFQGNYLLLTTQPSFYKIFFRLHRLIYSRRSFDVPELTKLSREEKDGKMLFIASVRTIAQELISGLNKRVGRWSYKAVEDALIEGLRASLGAQDYPLASHILSIFKSLHISTQGQIQLVIANHFYPEESRQSPKQRERENEYRIKVAENMMQNLQDDEITEKYFEETIVMESKFINKFDRDEWMTTLFINQMNFTAIDKVRLTLYSPSAASTPQWIHEAWLKLQNKADVSNDEIMKVIMSPIHKTIEPLRRF